MIDTKTEINTQITMKNIKALNSPSVVGTVIIGCILPITETLSNTLVNLIINTPIA